MEYADILAQVDERWRADFKRYLETDEASPEFEAFVNANDEMQRLVDLAQERKDADLGDIRQAFWRDIDRIHASAAETLRKSIAERSAAGTLVTSGSPKAGSDVMLLFRQMGTQVANVMGALTRMTRR